MNDQPMLSADAPSELGAAGARCSLAPGSGLVAVGNVGRFKPLKPGKIHLKCRRCKNTRSNMARSDSDPARAVVMVLNYCPRCDRGGEFEDVAYYDASGAEIDPDLENYEPMSKHGGIVRDDGPNKTDQTAGENPA
jgi:hypothetical protein